MSTCLLLSLRKKASVTIYNLFVATALRGWSGPCRDPRITEVEHTAKGRGPSRHSISGAGPPVPATPSCAVLVIPTQQRVDVSVLLHQCFSWFPFFPFQNLLLLWWHLVRGGEGLLTAEAQRPSLCPLCPSGGAFVRPGP